ncbi:lamin tail domain-containing protein [Streptacidiphilus griseoplanus]|uniref:lamin tail domain-containing protein n=1 Tax=Peterkaempfera griseoplana TaxID=66896 RepID=UPI000AB360E4|nr:lamin tail domain-containing protein [Peterkaempfera griseoplana]
MVISNNGRRTVNLAGRTLTDEDHHAYRFSRLRLGGGAHKNVTVHTGHGLDTDRNVHRNRRTYVWNNHHDTATLRNNRGRIADSVSWGHHHHR